MTFFFLQDSGFTYLPDFLPVISFGPCFTLDRSKQKLLYLAGQRGNNEFGSMDLATMSWTMLPSPPVKPEFPHCATFLDKQGTTAEAEILVVNSVHQTQLYSLKVRFRTCWNTIPVITLTIGKQTNEWIKIMNNPFASLTNYDINTVPLPGIVGFYHRTIRGLFIFDQVYHRYQFWPIHLESWPTDAELEHLIPYYWTPDID